MQSRIWLRKETLLKGAALAALLSISLSAQQPQRAVVPTLIQFSGLLKDGQAKPLTGTVSVTFSVYPSQEDGTPLWSETQEITPGADGSYSILLGAASQNGVPAELFSSGAARWLGIQTPEEPAQTRVLLVSVPYALKAADAETLGGKPASSFVLAGSPAGQASGSSSAGAPIGAAVTPEVTPSTTPSGSGTTGYIPVWTSSTNLGNSILFQGSGYVSMAGILDLPPVGAATTSTGYNSRPFYQVASAYNSSTSAAVAELFSWQAEPVGNNTAAPSGKLNLLFASGTAAPAETGVSISSTGALNLTGSINSALTLQGNVTDPNFGTSANVIGGYVSNAVASGVIGATIAGGGGMYNNSQYRNVVYADFGAVGGGWANSVGQTSGNGQAATVGGGHDNVASGDYSTVAGGIYNTATGEASIAAGGYQDIASGLESFAAGGYENTASGDHSFAAGTRGKAKHNGSFVWCQQNDVACDSKGTNSFLVSVSGPIYFYDGSGSQGCFLSAGSGSWSCSSDRNLKENIVPIDSRSVLERVTQMPISQWSMKADTAGHKHIGPMAQDFYAAFALGDTDKYIAQGDAQGVALASIQGLYQVVQEKEERIKKLEAQLQGLEERMMRFEVSREAAANGNH